MSKCRQSSVRRRTQIRVGTLRTGGYSVEEMAPYQYRQLEEEVEGLLVHRRSMGTPEEDIHHGEDIHPEEDTLREEDTQREEGTHRGEATHLEEHLLQTVVCLHLEGILEEVVHVARLRLAGTAVGGVGDNAACLVLL